MKRIFSIVILSLLLWSCRQPDEPDPAVSDFSFEQKEYFIDDVVKFNSSAEAIEHNWNFGDGGKSTLPNPSYAYGHPGEYVVEHTTFNVEGTASTTMDTIRVYGLVLENVRASESNYNSGWSSYIDRYLRISTKDDSQWEFNTPLQYDSIQQLYVNTYSIQNEFLVRNVNYQVRYQEYELWLYDYDFNFHVDPFDPEVLQSLRYSINDPDTDFEIELLFKKVL